MTTTALRTGAGGWALHDDARYVCYFAVAWIAHRLRANSRVTGESCSMGPAFALIALVELGAFETILIASCAILLDAILRRRSDQKIGETGTTLVSTVLAIATSQWVFHSESLIGLGLEWPVRFVAAALLAFAAAGLPVALGYVRRGRLQVRELAQSLFILSFPCYVIAAAATAGYAVMKPFIEWYATALLVPLLVLLWHGLQRYINRVDQYRQQANETLALQQRTMEVLALAIEKDQISAQHLRRMQLYAEGIGREMGLARVEIEALQAAALMHDVGKLAIPDHITSKPGPLTNEEFEKMKIHTRIGAGIVERAQFPYPVAPIVRSHHERWNGTGYPDGLKGEEIPVGARVLAVVDCLDALLTERSFRRALPLDDAVKQIVSRASTDFDPQVTAVLKRRYRQFERQLASLHPAMFEPAPARYLQSIGAARSEMSALFQLHEQLSRALTTSDVAHVLRTNFRDLVPYDAMVVYFDGSENAKPDLVCGDRTLIRRRRPLVTFAVPFSTGNPGRMAIYCALAERITPEHIRLLRGLLPRIGQSIENARKFSATANSATTDYLTRLPNMASLSQRLRDEVEAAARSNSEIIVMVCDLDGFKAVNDTLGHLTGNRVLIEVAQALSQNTRGSDYVARMGGDEFVLILPGNACPNVNERITELRRLVREAGRKACNADLIDASFGAAQYPRDGADAEELVAVADQRMYDDKTARKKGRTPAPTPPLSLSSEPLASDHIM